MQNEDINKDWHKALDLFGSNQALKNQFQRPIFHPELNSEEIIHGFIQVHSLLEEYKSRGEKISLRTLSAQCFHADSKFLDKRRKFLEHTFPIAKETVEPRVIMLSAYVPEQLQRAIFVENFDSFRATVKAVEESDFALSTAIIYSAGYRGSAGQIREIDTCQFVTINHTKQEHFNEFLMWWFSDNQSIDVFFWGDLDFDGMSIIKSLREKFHNVTALKPLYEAVLKYHQQGVSHGDLNSNQNSQTDPITTGCLYTDKVLLPILRDSRQFTDQEVLGGKELCSVISTAFGQ